MNIIYMYKLKYLVKIRFFLCFFQFNFKKKCVQFLCIKGEENFSFNNHYSNKKKKKEILNLKLSYKLKKKKKK